MQGIGVEESVDTTDGKLKTGESCKTRILVVDDNEDSATSLATMFDMLGHESQVAFDGIAAVEAAESFKPDVVLLDIGLPKMNGITAARKIREQAWGKTIFLIAVTGWGEEKDKRQTAEAGFDLHLVKPIDPMALEDLLTQRQRKTPIGK